MDQGGLAMEKAPLELTNKSFENTLAAAAPVRR